MLNKFWLLPAFCVVIPCSIVIVLSQFKASTQVKIKNLGKIIEQNEIVQTSKVERSSKKITFVGDVLMARNVEFLINSNGQSYPFKNSKSLFSDSAHVIGNFESAILKQHKKTPSFVTTFSVDKKFLPLLTQVGFSHVSLANNHSFDYGSSTFEYTVSSLSESGLQPFGHPQVVDTNAVSLIESGDYTIGLLALNQIFTNLDWGAVLTQIQSLESTSDYQIVYIHWGEEYILKHTTKQEQFAKKLLDSGIDAVIGHHPHVTQDIEIYNGKPIFYSLGNFLFDQYFSVDVQQGLVVQLVLASSTVNYTLIPVSSEGAKSQPYVMAREPATLFLANLARRSTSEYRENIKNGKLILPLLLATSTQSGMIAP